MKNAKIKKLEPKEWLDRVIDNLDQLRILDKALRPEEVTYTCLDVSSVGRPFPPVHIGADNVCYFANLLGLPIERKFDRCYGDMEVSITYRAHHIFGIRKLTEQEAQKLWS